MKIMMLYELKWVSFEILQITIEIEIEIEIESYPLQYD
jgi:hypothetical protein